MAKGLLPLCAATGLAGRRDAAAGRLAAGAAGDARAGPAHARLMT